MRRQICQWLRPWIKSANTFAEALQLLRAFWQQTVPQLRARLVSQGVDVDALPALGGDDDSPADAVFTAGGVFKKMKVCLKDWCTARYLAWNCATSCLSFSSRMSPSS